MQHRELVEKYLYYPKREIVSASALAALCRWGLAGEYLDQIKMFIKGVDWDGTGDVRLIAVSCAGEYLSENFDKELLDLLFDFSKNLGEPGEISEINSGAVSLRSCAYEALAQAIGKDLLGIQDGKEGEKLSKIGELLKKPPWENLSKEEISYVVNRIKNNECEDAVELSWAIKALGRTNAVQYRQLVEKYLYYPEEEFVSASALATLYNWGLASEYLDQIKLFIKGVDWDRSEDVRSIALSRAGEYLRDHFDRELLELLLDFFENLGETEGIIEMNVGCRSFMKSCAYHALARAMGQARFDIQDVEEVDKLIEEDKFDQIDMTVIQKAHQMLNQKC